MANSMNDRFAASSFGQPLRWEYQLMPLSSCYAQPPPVGGLILGYGGTDARQIHDGIRRLAMCIENHEKV